MLRAAASVAIFGAVCAAPAADEVLSLPGWKGALPSRWWSGFLDLPNSEKRIHYTFIEKMDDPEAATAPVVMWTNGGPGCSGYDGLLYEHGPLLISHDGTELVYNEDTWAKHANMLYIEAPAGVGFSYSGAPNTDYTTGDNQTATDNHAALIEFFAKFPEYKGNDFYTSGESYAGVYVPTLSYKIFKDEAFPGNMKGFLCGNCVFDNCGSSSIPFYYGHGALPQDLYDEAVVACGSPYFNNFSQECQSITQEARMLAYGLNGYDFYRDCYHTESHNAKLQASTFRPWLVTDELDRLHLREQVGLPRPPHPAVGKHHQLQQRGLPSELSPVPCIDSDGATLWLNRADVQKALHVEESTVPYWSICSDLVGYMNDGVFEELSPLYREMMEKYRIIVYNGDSDPSCNYLSDEWCVQQLGAPVKDKWASWHYNDSSVTSQGSQVGGWTVTYDVGGELRFITIKGAGHMAPQWRPKATTTMFKQFLAGKVFTQPRKKRAVVV